MRSSVQMLFQVDKSTAVSTQPIKAMRKCQAGAFKGIENLRVQVGHQPAQYGGLRLKGHDGAYQ